MNQNNFQLNHSSDDTLDLLKDFLPQIEQELRQQIEPILIQQFEQKTKTDLEHIENQAELQYQDAQETLQGEFQQLKKEKEKELSEQLTILEQQLAEQEQKNMAIAQQRFLQQNLDSRILSHPKMQEVADEMQNEFGQALLQTYDQIRQKKAKQLRIRLQSRQQRQRNEIDKAIHTQIYAKSGLQELRQQVKHFKISLASLKSKYNLKINGINKDIQQINRRSKQVQFNNSDQLIQELSKQIESIKEKQIIHQESSISQDQYLNFEPQQNYQEFNMRQTFNINSNHQKFANYPETQFIHQDVDLDSSDSLDQVSQNHPEQSDSQIPMPPQHKNMLSHLLSSTQYEPQTTQQNDDIYLQVPTQPLLKFNIAQMLRDQWYEDDLDKYLSVQNQKENKCSNLPNSNSNFNSLYQEHLARLNESSKPKRKLSEKAKLNLLNHLSSQRQKRQQSSLKTSY